METETRGYQGQEVESREGGPIARCAVMKIEVICAQSHDDNDATELCAQKSSRGAEEVETKRCPGITGQLVFLILELQGEQETLSQKYGGEQLENTSDLDFGLRRYPHTYALI